MKSAEQTATPEPTIAPVQGGNQEFIIHHPDAEQDPDRAQVMAEASKVQEEAYRAYKTEAQVRRWEAVGPGDGNQWLQTLASTAEHTSSRYRKAADSRQEIAGLAYDKGYDVVITPHGAAKSETRLRRIGNRLLRKA
jgi:hypothetical protein